MVWPAKVAVAAMVVVASAGESAPVAIAEIQDRLGVTRSYAALIMGKLKSSGLIRSVTGTRGGYVLSRPGAGISIGDIVLALNGVGGRPSRSTVRTPERSPQIWVGEVWVSLDERVIGFLESVSIESMVPSNSHAVPG